MLGWAVDPKITLLRVIPTMTFQNHHDRFYVSLISCQVRVARHISYLLKCLWLLSTSQISCRTSSDILSGISSDILSGISLGILSDILSHILPDISSDILSRGWGPAGNTGLRWSPLRSNTGSDGRS